MKEAWLVWEFDHVWDDIVLDSLWDTREGAINHVENEIPRRRGSETMRRWRYVGDKEWPVEFEIDCHELRHGVRGEVDGG